MVSQSTRSTVRSTTPQCHPRRLLPTKSSVHLCISESVSVRLVARLGSTCTEHDKAFEDSTFGTVLSVHFSTANVNWSLPSKKLLSLQHLVDNCLSESTLTLLQLQHRLILSLTAAQKDHSFTAQLLHPAAADLHTWTNVIACQPTHFLPSIAPSLTALAFVPADATGARFIKSDTVSSRLTPTTTGQPFPLVSPPHTLSRSMPAYPGQSVFFSKLGTQTTTPTVANPPPIWPSHSSFFSFAAPPSLSTRTSSSSQTTRPSSTAGNHATYEQHICLHFYPDIPPRLGFPQLWGHCATPLLSVHPTSLPFRCTHSVPTLSPRTPLRYEHRHTLSHAPGPPRLARLLL